MGKIKRAAIAFVLLAITAGLAIGVAEGVSGRSFNSMVLARP